MNALEFKGTWNIIRGSIKQALARLACDDAQFVEGKKIELKGRSQKRSGRALHAGR
jgi:uncharacterized protein YjbJ (UPF0337 family)